MTDVGDDPIDTFPSWLRTLRKRLRLSQTALAQRLGIARATVARWEGGITRPLPIFRHVLTLMGRDVGMNAPPEES